ncbi:UDP-N-acetylmuramoyl-L-alanyl-D-glutamate--2,6-diaminopimelate ligase [Candidatus Omnitrophota bacterium]
MNVKQLFPEFKAKLDGKLLNLAIQGISCDSRTVSKNYIFVAIEGAILDARAFIPQAIKKGARVVIRKSKNNHKKIKVLDGVLFIDTPNPRKTLSELSAKIFQHPSDNLKAIGITGTNGKTTVSYILEEILSSAGFNTGLIGTINYRFKHAKKPSINTTPGPVQVQSMLASMVKSKTDYCLMEVSSHALDQNRVNDINFYAAIFTNLTRDHLDYHQTIDRYFSAKAKLFRNLSKKSIAVVNRDDPFAKRLIRLTPAKIISYGLSKESDVSAQDIEITYSGTNLCIQTPEGMLPIRTRLIGFHNVYNILAAVSLCLREAIDFDIIQEALYRFRGTPGRLESVDCGQAFRVLVDYAHTDDALENVLRSLRAIDKRKIILVFGCGGDRDKTKRPKMGRIATQLADSVIITNDNPRSENPRDIVCDIKKGVTANNYHVIFDRSKAIEKALSLARETDVVLIAGKGHETKQILKSKVMAFDDRKEAKRILRCLPSKKY